MRFLIVYGAFWLFAVGGYTAANFAGWQPFSANGDHDHLPAGMAGNRTMYPSFWATGFGGK